MALQLATPTPDDNEQARLRSLRSYQILDTLPDPTFDEIAWMAARFCDTPMALISLVDESRCWFKARVGTSVESLPRTGSFCEAAVQRHDIMVIPDATNDPRFASHPLVPMVRFYAGAPLHMPDGHNIGTLCVLDKTPRQLTEQQRLGLRSLAKQTVTLLTYHHLVVRDELTGLFNRRYLFDALDRELHRADRRNEPVSLLMLDVDRFKSINDQRGHAAGDTVLRYLGVLLKDNTRGGDVVARYGGEEFVVLLPGTQAHEALACAENLRKKISEVDFSHDGEVLPRVTVSIGVASYPDNGKSIGDFVNAADAALYQAKNGGRNRVHVSDHRATT